MIAARALFASVVCAVLAAGCDNRPPEVDAGMIDSGVDAGPPDGGPPLACTSTMRLDGVSEGTVTVTLDTSMTEERPRDLGLGCGNTDAELRWAPEEIVELHVPGTGPVAVELDTDFPETDPSFNTVLQVRKTCAVIPEDFPPTCFDDIATDNYHSDGAVTAMGGDVLYIVVTGYSEPPAEQHTVDSGHIRLDVHIRANSPPTVTSGSVVLALEKTRIIAAGNDPDGDARGVVLNFLNAAGQLIDIYGDGTADPDQDFVIVRFAPPPATPDYDGFVELLIANTNGTSYPRGANARTARMRVFDSAFAMSSPFDVPIQEATLVGKDETCDVTHVCRTEMTCDATMTMTCVVPPAIATACSTDASMGGTATALTALTPTADMMSTVMVSGTTGAGPGLFATAVDCIADGNPDGTIGAEKIYAFTVPDILNTTFDLTATTEAPTATTDTVLYLRSICADSGSELACNDDRAANDFQSDIVRQGLAAGTYYLFVERYTALPSGTAPHSLTVTLKAVLPPLAACDMTGANNRCATGTCTGGFCPPPT
jgi:hypothetical protein